MKTRILFVLVALLLVAGTARAETYDFYVFTYCPTSDPMCGFASNAAYRDYIKTAVQEMNLEWERVGISFRPVVFNIQADDYYGVTMGCDGDVSQTIKDRRAEWKANVAGVFPNAISVMITPGGSWCCSHIPGTPYGAPENDVYPALFGIFCSTSWPAVELGGILAHEVGHYFCLVHTQTFQDPATNGPNPDHNNDDGLFAIFDTAPDPARQEGFDPDGPGGDLDMNGNPVNGHEWCSNMPLSGLTDDGSPHATLCQPTCFLFDNNTLSTTSAQPPSNASMSYYQRGCIGPYVENGQVVYAFSDDSVDQIRNVCIPQVPERANLPDVCATHGGDTDHDGICNSDDNCPQDKNTTQKDSDGDGDADACDLCPNDPTPTGDLDGDGVGDLCDPDKDGDTCDNGVDDDPDNGKVRVGYQFNGGCGFGIEPVFASAGVDSDLDGVKGCADVDNDNDGICDGPAPHGPGSPGAPNGCAAGPDPCTEAVGLGCYAIQGSPVLCQPPWLVCLGGGCVEFFMKIVSVINPADEIVLDGGLSMLNRKIYTAPLQGATLSQTGKALAGDFEAVGFLTARQEAGSEASVSSLNAPGRVRLEVWSRRTGMRVAIVGEYDPSQVTLGDLRRGAWLEIAPVTDRTGQQRLEVAATYDPYDSADPPDPDLDGRPDSVDNCLLASNFLQADADGDGFGNACDADIDGDLLVTAADIAAVQSCAGADLSYEGLIAEPGSDEGSDPPDPDLTALKIRCGAMDLNDDTRVDAADESIARNRLGLVPGPSAQASSATACSPADCDDGLPCTIDYCDTAAGVCRHVPGSCDDGDPCTDDSCNTTTGACLHASVACDDGNPCTRDFCSQAAGGCTTALEPEGRPCDDGNPCTLGGGCHLGTCVGGSPLPNLSPCSDGNPCTLGDVCRDGVCQAQPRNCDDGIACTVDTCLPSTGLCSHVTMACDDGNVCTIDSCAAATGQCVHAPAPFDQAGLTLTGPASLAWTGPAGARWNTYRGTIPAGMMRSRPVPYDHVCLETLDFLEDGPASTLDPGLPPPGTAFYYFVSERRDCGEGPPGFDGSGAPVPNASPCVLGP